MRILYWRPEKPSSALAEAAFCLTPKVSRFDSGEIYLDVEGTAQLFGGEGELVLKAEKLLGHFPEAGTIAAVLVDRPEWAAALVGFPGETLLVPPGKSLERLWSLPIDRLVLCGDPAEREARQKEITRLAAFMRRVGLTVIGEFARLPEIAVTRRFGKSGLELHAWVHGRLDLCLPPFVPTEPIQERMDTDDVTSLESLFIGLRELLSRVEARLHGRAAAAKQLRLTFTLESHPAFVKTVNLLYPCREMPAMMRVLKELLAPLTWESPLVRLELEITDQVTHQAGQLSLFDDMENRFADLSEHVARLRARFGDNSVGFAQLRESYLPERTWHAVWPPESPPLARDWYPRRPLFLYNPPRPLSGPPRGWELMHSENLATEWWEWGGERAYYIARSPQGECWWIYRDLVKEKWFLHGSFD